MKRSNESIGVVAYCLRNSVPKDMKKMFSALGEISKELKAFEKGM